MKVLKFRALCAPVAAAALLLSAGQPARVGALGLLQINPSTRLHPALQETTLVDPTTQVSVIVQTVKLDSNLPGQIASKLIGATVVEQFKVVPAFVLSLPASGLNALAADPNVRYVSPDGPIHVLPQLAPTATGTASHPQAPQPANDNNSTISSANLKTTYPFDVNAPSAWSGAANWDGNKLTGANVAVAVLDSGIDSTHADLRTHVVAVNVNQHTQNTADGYGHGTHVAGIIAGNDPTGQYIGIAPNATLISVKVTDDSGSAFESDLLRGLDWVNTYRGQYHIMALNLSVTSNTPQSYATSPIDAAVEFLVHQNITVVAAAGNLGSAADAVWYPPANDPMVITVGCLDDNQTTLAFDDSLCPISSRGVTEDGFAKPDVVAPGRKIISALSSGINGNDPTIAQQFPTRITSDGRHIRLSGTSMSAPAVTGAVALILERSPGLQPNQVRSLLVGTATKYPGQADHAGAINIKAAIAGSQNPPQNTPNSLGPLPVDATAYPSGHALLWDGANWGTAYWHSAHWDATHLDSAHWDTAYWNSAHWDSAYWDSAQWDSAHWDSAQWDSAHWDSAHWDSAHWDSAHWDSAHWDSSSYD